MSTEIEWFVLGVIVVFAFVQSIFGVGLLVFGTPTLLLAGFSFAETLATLLPASIVISALQVRNGARIEKPFLVRLGFFCLIPLAVSLFLVLHFEFRSSLHLIVALLLLVFVVLRLTPGLEDRVKRFVSVNQSAWLFATGVVHGLSNLGGGLLTILASSVHRDKSGARNLIAVCYLVFAAIQLAVLVATTPASFSWSIALYALVAGVVFSTVGEYSFRRVSNLQFDRLLALVMLLYASVLLFRTLL